MKLDELNENQLKQQYDTVLQEYIDCKEKHLNLNMARGKPSREQLDLSNDMLNMYIDPDETVSDGVDARNYGELRGLPSCRRLFAEILGVRYEQVIIGGSSSLNMMYDVISKAYTHGLLNSQQPWAKLNSVKFLCPSPGYDRHFAISKSFDMHMIPIPLNDDGPDMDMVEKLIADPQVKGMWCVPKFSNPDGIVYSESVIERIAAMKPAAPDFLLMWDNAYCVHDIEGDYKPIKDIIRECEANGNANMVFEFASTSKMTFPGAGVSCIASSEENIDYLTKLMSAQIISYDKLNQLRHVMFFKDRNGVVSHMKKHASILKPKFDVVLGMLQSQIEPLGIADWRKPAGGYFVSLNTMPGCAKRTQQLCKEAGVTLTGAGATYPYGNDPMDSNLRIAPSFPPLDELQAAMHVFCTCLKLAAIEKLLGM